MNEEETAAQQDLNSSPPQDEALLDLDEHWKKLRELGLVIGPPPPSREERVDPSTMRPIRYHGTNEDLLRDLGRCR